MFIDSNLAEHIALTELRVFRAQILFCIMETRMSPTELLKACQAFHNVNEVIKLYE